VIVTLEIPPETLARIERHGRAAAGAARALAGGLLAAAVRGADAVAERLVKGELGLQARHPGTGLAASVAGWMIDEAAPLAAVGVPANAPAAAYAAMLERGGVIRPRKAGALAVPVSEEAKRYEGPRQMAGLTFIRRLGRPPLLVRLKGRGGASGMEVHWVLLQSVTIPAFAWLSKGVEGATPEMTATFAEAIGAYLAEWN